MLYVDVIAGRMTTNPYSSSAHHDYSSEFWDQMHQSLRHLYGRPVLSNSQTYSAAEDAARFVERCTTAELFDFMEMSFKLDCSWRVFSEENVFVDAVNEIFRLENAPYQLTPIVKREEQVTHPGPRGFARVGTTIHTVAYPKVVRVDEEVAHAEAIVPALSVLADSDYGGANDEFRKALEDYRKGDNEDCVAKCGQALESVLKVLCQKNRIPFDAKKETAGPLLDKVLGKSGLNTATFKEPLITVARLRNYASHGGGARAKKVEPHVAQYALTSTAAAIVLLVHDMGK
jgi:hypothetical protein